MTDALSLVTLSQVALSVGLPLGFSAAEVERRVHPDNLGICLIFTWGDWMCMSAPRLRTPCEYGLSWDEQATCSRKSRTLTLPESAQFESTDELKKRFTEALLEIAA